MSTRTQTEIREAYDHRAWIRTCVRRELAGALRIDPTAARRLTGLINGARPA